MSKEEAIIAAADGSALGNPGPAGWAWYVDQDNWAAGGWKHATNNMGELRAVLELLRATEQQAERPLHIFCDSQYTIKSITQWMPGWKKKGWKKADGKPVQNLELMQDLDAALAGRSYRFEWVKGHSGQELNEKADDLARAAALAYRAGKSPKRGPGFSSGAAPAVGEKRQKTQPGAAPLSDLSQDALEQQDRAAEEEHSSLIAQIGPERLAARQEELLLRPEVYANASRLDSILTQDFSWLTAQGKVADRQTVIDKRERAFLSLEAQILSSQLLGESAALVLSRVLTGQGELMRTSIWVRENYRNEIGAWLLHFRQETAC
ncbi:MAG: ribonuclease HI family protein [Rothia sp. (in: high G+C Gram-positive bacteria)]|nr:ribonuclease HI family protein [Rothia sp. (in: high G+C Gram-positive bacteria)]